MAKPGPHGKGKQRCGALTTRGRNWDGGRAYCRNWPVKLFGRCRFHGGMSTGPKTPEGKARAVAAMVEGRKRWLEKLKAEGQKVPCGPKAKKFITKLKAEIEEAKHPARREQEDIPPRQHKKRGRPTNEERMARLMSLHKEFVRQEKAALQKLME